jgi:hypothetical protein
VPSIRILKTPAGEAPEPIRRAWVGLTLPLAPEYPAREEFRAFGVLSGPRTLWRMVWSLLTRRHFRYDGYAVATLSALEALRVRDPAAAEWWQTHTPHLLNPHSRLIFEAEACEEIP